MMTQEEWLSGRRHRTRNAARGQPLREFESHLLRQSLIFCQKANRIPNNSKPIKIIHAPGVSGVKRINKPITIITKPAIFLIITLTAFLI